MRRLLFLILLLVIAGLPVTSAAAQQADTTGAVISSLQAGDVLQGLVSIRGSANLTGFLAYEITFGYANDTTGTWFLIGESTDLVQDGILVEWDTSTISDGNYNLRLTVFQDGGLRTHFLVQNIRVRNYTPIETITPTPTLTPTPITETAEPMPSATITPIPTATSIPASPTPLPANPVEISASDLSDNLMRGAAGALALFVLAGLYASIQRIIQRR